MKSKFDIDKIVKYLEKYKSDLPYLYRWTVNIDKLVDLETLTAMQVEEIEPESPYEKAIKLKKIVGQKLNNTPRDNSELFDKLCLWIIKDWGGIKTAKDSETLNIIKEFLNQNRPTFNRIASASKVGAFLYPDRYVIYDSRVIYALNWVILSEDAGQQYFPIPEGRNSKMAAFDMRILIRLKNLSFYRPENIQDLDNRLYIKNCDKNVFIEKEDAYSELNNLVKEINQKLWKGDAEKVQNLYYTEMHLFSIADREVIMDITTKYEAN